jgi:glycosyltransferase involved in cell wall biosynthesis
MLTDWADKKHHRLELEVLQEADKVISIGQTMNDEFVEMYLKAGGKTPEKFSVIGNGYDNDDLSKISVEKDKKFSIAHIGTLVKDRNPGVLWKVLKKIISENPAFEKELEIKLVGKIDIFVKEEIEKAGLSSYVNKIEYLPHDQVILEQQKSKVLLLLVNNTKNAKGILTGKFYEYMAANVPVLAIGPVDGDLAEQIRETNVGLISGFDDERALENNILNLFANQKTVRHEAAVEKYSRRNLTKELAGVLSSL